MLCASWFSSDTLLGSPNCGWGMENYNSKWLLLLLRSGLFHRKKIMLGDPMRNLVADHRAMHAGCSIMESGVNARVNDFGDHVARPCECACCHRDTRYRSARQRYVDLLISEEIRQGMGQR